MNKSKFQQSQQKDLIKTINNRYYANDIYLENSWDYQFRRGKSIVVVYHNKHYDGKNNSIVSYQELDLQI